VVKYCDYVLELGPLSGENGGELIFFGPGSEFFKGSTTLTQKSFAAPISFTKTGKKFDRWLYFKKAATHNLKHFDFKIPAHSFTVITGVSGAGKTTLLYNEIFLKNKNLKETGDNNLEGIKEIVFVDPGIGSVRSSTNAAGFFGFFATIRELFAARKESLISGYTPGHFSFNSPFGRCEQCGGKGYEEIEMQFLPSVKIICSDCSGKGYRYDVLKIKYKEKNISEILDLSIDRFIDLAWDDLPLKQRQILLNISENGLGYIKIGQKLKALSAGELQRVKLLKYLNTNRRNTLFLVDEPSFGLHDHDIGMVKNLIDKIRQNDNTVVAAEHNISLIAHADYIIELGHEGGHRGGYLVFQGSIQDIRKNPESITGAYLRKNPENIQKNKKTLDK
jgi:excinuclease ABC subunit A